MSEAKPIFKKENLLYEREEKEGYWTFIPKLHPETKDLTINTRKRPIKEILRLSDGSRTLKMIEEELMKMLPNIDRKKITMEVAQSIASFSRLGIIEWDGDNPFLYRKEEPITDGVSLMIAQESDLRRLNQFISSTIFNLHQVEDSNYISYTSPNTSLKEYQELTIRQKLFSFNEEFFLLLRREKVEGLISIEVPLIPTSVVAKIKLLISPREYFSHLINYAQDNFPFLSIINITKLRVVESVKNPLKTELKELLMKTGFIDEATLKDELGFGEDIKYWSRSYDVRFIEKITAMRTAQLIDKRK